MKSYLYIENNQIGEVDLEIIDIYMGVLSGKLIPNKEYNSFKETIFNHFEEKGISNSEDFNYKIILESGLELKPIGGIGITHSRQFENEIIVETAGNDIEKIKNYA